MAIGPDLPRDVNVDVCMVKRAKRLGSKARRLRSPKHCPPRKGAARRISVCSRSIRFVSSDSPLAVRSAFADAKIGDGFFVVRRAVDNSKPPAPGGSTVDLPLVGDGPREHSIPVQYGVNRLGGERWLCFPLRYGFPWMWRWGWPLRYAHSPGEVIDTKDVDALGKKLWRRVAPPVVRRRL